MADSIVKATRLYLATQTSLTALLGSDTVWDTWIFNNFLTVTVEGSGKTALVIEYAGAWAQANQYNTLRFPRMKFTIYADPTRDASRNLSAHNGPAKIDAVFNVLDSLLHRTDGMDEMWGTVRLMGSSRLSEPVPLSVTDGDSMSTASVYYGYQI